MKALLSVSDKEGLVDFAKGLVKLGYELISTGGTYELLKKNNIKALEVSSLTNFPECFEGRVKTLNPYIHGAILHKRKAHAKEAKELGISAIDLVCVNLYPFANTIEKTNDFDEIIENIDIGGPAMLRSSAKNFADVLSICDKSSYGEVLQRLENKSVDLEFKRSLMIKTFEHTASYDCMIANYMNKRFSNDFGDKKFIVGQKAFDTRYGENPHQKGALYEDSDHFTNNFQSLKGEASFNNMSDISACAKVVAAFGDKKAVCIVKHSNPCGFAIKNTLLEAYESALLCDSVSAYGGVACVNGIIDLDLAKKMNEIFLELIYAVGFTPEALNELSKKKRIKLFKQGGDKKYITLADEPKSFKSLNGGFLYQDSDILNDDEVLKAKAQTNLKANENQKQDMLIAYKIAALTKSNCVVYVKDSVLVAIGMGMTSRVDASKAALAKAKTQGLDIKGASLASEAFFPFRDSIDAAFEAGVACVIEPGGSIRDDEVICAAKEHKMALYFSGFRHFLH